MKWFVEPDTVRIDLGDGQWIEVKAELTKGERDKANAFMYRESVTEGKAVAVDIERMPKAEAMAYLVDWSLTRNGQKVSIDSDADRLAALDKMSEAAFEVVSSAIKAHVEKAEADRPSKKDRRGVRGLKATSASAA